MQVKVLRQACCAADDQLGPLDAVFTVDEAASLAELVERIRAARFLQFSATHDRLFGEVGERCLVEVCAPGGPAPVFHADPAVPVRALIGPQTLFFNFRR